MKKRIIALLLCLAMAVSVFTGCSGKSEEYTAGAESNSASDQIPQAAKDDLISYLTDGALSADATVFTVNGEEIPTDYYIYWLAYHYNQLWSYYSYYGSTPSLTDEEDGVTVAEALQDLADQAVTSYVVMNQVANERGMELSDADLKTIQDFAQNQEENYLLYNAATTSAIERVNRDYKIFTALGELLYQKGGEYFIPNEDVEAYIKDKGMYNCRYILCKVDEDNDAETAKAACQSYYDELSALSGEKQLERFKELQENNPDGNTDEFSFDADSSLTEGFRETLETMEVGDIAMTDETGYGYFVILRLDCDLTEVGDTMSRSDFASKLEQWTYDAAVEKTADYEKLDTVAVLTRLQELQQILVSVENAEHGDASAQ